MLGRLFFKVIELLIFKQTKKKIEKKNRQNDIKFANSRFFQEIGISIFLRKIVIHEFFVIFWKIEFWIFCEKIVKLKILTCQTPTIALAIKIRRMTKGSTNAVMDSSSSSKKAKTKEMIAASKRILTRRSSNCSKTNCQMDLPSSAGNSERIKINRQNKQF